MNMMNVYRRTVKIYLENEVVGGYSSLVLQKDSEAVNYTKEGNAFADFWDELNYYSWMALECARWERGIFSRKRRIEPWHGGQFKTWKEDGTTREWKIEWTETISKCQLEEFKKFNVDDVIQYFKERGINSINL